MVAPWRYIRRVVCSDRKDTRGFPVRLLPRSSFCPNPSQGSFDDGGNFLFQAHAHAIHGIVQGPFERLFHFGLQKRLQYCAGKPLGF